MMQDVPCHRRCVALYSVLSFDCSIVHPFSFLCHDENLSGTWTHIHDLDPDRSETAMKEDKPRVSMLALTCPGRLGALLLHQDHYDEHHQEQARHQAYCRSYGNHHPGRDLLICSADSCRIPGRQLSQPAAN
jgi:hypothetical protein